MRFAKIAVPALLGLMLVQGVTGVSLLSVTSDELTHIASGYSYVATGEIRLNLQHPPLVKLLAGIPLVFQGLQVDLADPALVGESPDEWSFGFDFFEANDADRVLFWARLPILLLSLLGGWIVFAWARDLFGGGAGIAALSLYALDPTVVAHSRLVTMDVPLAVLTVATLYALWRYVRGLRPAWLVASGLALGAALATKYSALLLPPLVAVLLGAGAVGGVTRADRSRRVRRTLVALFGVLAIALAVVWAAFLFPANPLVYLEGVARVNVDHDPSYPYYLLGEFRQGGFWYYFAAAFLFKTPLPTLMLLAASLVGLPWLRARSWLDEAFLALPALTFFVATSAFADNLGVRYLLPVYPLLFVWISRLARLLEAPGRRARRLAAATAVGAGIWIASIALFIHPDQLSFFNMLAGGPANGHRVLDDSNIDWGQDLKRLKRWIDRSGVEQVRLKYWGNASPDYYGIPWTDVTDREWARQPLPGVYAFSTHLLIRGEYYAREHGFATDWLSRYDPIDRVGYSIYLFRFE